MSELAQTVEQLEKDLNKFLRVYSQLQSENRNLKEQLVSAEEKIAEAKNSLAVLERENELIRVAGAMGGDESGREAAKSKIGELVREIDKCVAQLNG